jgi:hypothetical protein
MRARIEHALDCSGESEAAIDDLTSGRENAAA